MVWCPKPIPNYLVHPLSSPTPLLPIHWKKRRRECVHKRNGIQLHPFAYVCHQMFDWFGQQKVQGLCFWLFWVFNVRQQLKENVGSLDEFMKYFAIHGAGGSPVCVLYLASSVHVLRLRWPVCPLWMQFDTEMAHSSQAYEWIRDLHTVTACHSLSAYQKTELFLVQCMFHPHVEVDLTAQVQEQCYHTEIRSN